jgi:putative hemolysin
MSALISGAEIALFYIAPYIHNRTNTSSSRKSLLLNKWFENPLYLKNSLKISGLVFKFLLIIYVVRYAVTLLSPIEEHPGYFFLFIVVFIILYVIIIEIIPKAYAEAIPEKYTIFSTYYLIVVFTVLSPAFKLYGRIYTYFLLHSQQKKDTGYIEENPHPISSEDEFTDEEDIAKGIAKFGNIDVSQILRPKVDVVAIDFNQSLQEIVQVILESGYSRIPVYEGDFDNMKGILYVKDLLPFIYSKDNFIWQVFIRPPYFVPESKKVIELLNEFKASKIHMAIIVDEYGCILGIVTLEDVLEEIVGEISDESDDEENFYSKINDNTFIFDAKILLNDFYKIVKSEPGFFDQVKGDADTLAGLILELKGEIPVPGEELKYKQFIFTIESVDSRRIKQIKVVIDKDLYIIDANI